MDRRTGKLLQGWDHVQQSMEIIFETPFHERVLRRWVGSFVPRLLGEEIVYRIITRFWWAIAEALDLWEPNYRIKHVYFMGGAQRSAATRSAIAILSDADLIRQGQVIFPQRRHLSAARAPWRLLAGATALLRRHQSRWRVMGHHPGWDYLNGRKPCYDHTQSVLGYPA